ncbi:PREDICTED: interleukin-34 [Condylura cristata]|uniref:interleukin-34 n=1 Tax=Condylura cristata TaxID=143302 RepID=UPI000643D8E1|nr:PREDICTED: interleukin-34 [Condylura cristata]XP_012586185.1 PREDICTED: interleukin-34 [Condylura cristata]XP_012586186.1 PREDICTED: interleukin-34 [Condylura cristata]
MPQGFAWLHYLGLLLGMALGHEGLEAWPLAQGQECTVTGFLRDKLQYKNRLQYMKHYFPINYRVSVPYEVVLRTANITRLQRTQVSQQELRYLWALVSFSATESVQEVLLEGHPSWKYLEEVQTLLLHVRHLTAVNTSPRVEALLSLLSTPGLSLKPVRPKALLDNCFRVMDLLYCSCCKQSSIQSWQDCEVPSPEPHSPDPSMQCEAAWLYPPHKEPPNSLPHSPEFKAGPQ